MSDVSLTLVVGDVMSTNLDEAVIKVNETGSEFVYCDLSQQPR